MRRRLARLGIPEPILVRWEKRFGGKLLPLQCRAIEEYGLLEGTSLLISAPTSSGKTFCGEMALVRAIQERKKAIFLVPLKAVAEEKYRHFSECYGDLGLRLVIATRDHPENDVIMNRGQFDIAVMVYEKFNSLLLTGFDLMSQVGTVVIDELQMLEDEARGAQLELALTKLLHCACRPQLIALSAVLGEATDLARWLGCRLLLEKMRPVELRRGVAVEGRFYYRCHNSGELGEEICREGEDIGQTLFGNIKETVALGRQALVFLKSRRETAAAAQRFAQYAELQPIPENEKYFDERFIDEEESSLLKNLRSLAAAGIAFHNADLTAGQRLAVEEGYRAGLIKVIFCTTTLSTGINLPAASVYIEAQKYRRQSYSGRPGLEPLSWAEYESMSGRAGRIGLMNNDGIGQAVLLASSELEKSILWEYYIDKRPAPISSRLPGREMADILIDIFSSGLVKNAEEAMGLLIKSYAGSCNRLVYDTIGYNIEVLHDMGFLARQGDHYIATPSGKAVAVSGLTIAGADHIMNKSPLPESGSDGQILYHLFGCPDAGTIHFPMASRQDRLGMPDRCFPGPEDDNPLIRDLAAMQRELAPEELARLKLVFVIEDWMKGTPAIDIESVYSLHPGMMENLGYQAGWLLASSAVVIRAADRFSVFPLRLESLAFSARTGLPCCYGELYRDFGGLLLRSEWLALLRRGIGAKREFLDRGYQVLSHLVSSEERLNKIDKQIIKIKEDVMQFNGRVVLSRPVWPESIEIDGTPIRERFRIRINGQAINLTGKSFKYLLRLVWSRLTKDNGWLYKDELERGFNQARYLYRLRQEIGRDFLPDWPLYENNRSGYYRLAAEPDGLRVNVDALREIPDYEIQQMAVDLSRS